MRAYFGLFGAQGTWGPGSFKVVVEMPEGALCDRLILRCLRPADLGFILAMVRILVRGLYKGFRGCLLKSNCNNTCIRSLIIAHLLGLPGPFVGDCVLLFVMFSVLYSLLRLSAFILQCISACMAAVVPLVWDVCCDASGRCVG